MATNVLNSPDRSLLKLVIGEDNENTYNLTQSLYYTDVEIIELLHNKTVLTVNLLLLNLTNSNTVLFTY